MNLTQKMLRQAPNDLGSLNASSTGTNGWLQVRVPFTSVEEASQQASPTTAMQKCLCKAVAIIIVTIIVLVWPVIALSMATGSALSPMRCMMHAWLIMRCGAGPSGLLPRHLLALGSFVLAEASGYVH